MSDQVTVTIPDLHKTQKQVIAESSRYNVLNCGRRWGKNILLHDRVIDGVIERLPVAWCSPTYKNLADDWRTLTDTLAPIIKDKSEQEHRVEIITGGTVEMWSLDSPEPIRGRSYGRAIINEAAIVRGMLDTWNKILRPTLIDLKGDAWFASTPRGMNDWHTLYSFGAGGQPDWKSWTYTSYDNPFIDPAELDALKLTMSEAEYNQEILAQFIQNEGAVFRNLDAVLTAPKCTYEQHKGHTLVAGVDWGKDNDFTVISIGCVECQREVHLDRFNQIDYYYQLQRIEEMHSHWHVARWIAELNSIGTPLFEQLQRKQLPITGFTTTQTSKTALIEAFGLALEKADIQLLNDPAGRVELQAYERTTSANGLSRYSAPEGGHDDTVISRALMYRLLKETRPISNQVKLQRMRQDYQQLRKVL
jgi:hypothetical protein